MLSKYVDDYLDGNEYRLRVRRKPITPGTFFTYILRGSAKNYAVKYTHALINACVAVGACEVKSAQGGRAFIRPLIK